MKMSSEVQTVLRGVYVAMLGVFVCYMAYALALGPIAAAYHFKTLGWNGMPKVLLLAYPDVPWVPGPLREPYDKYLIWCIY